MESPASAVLPKVRGQVPMATGDEQARDWNCEDTEALLPWHAAGSLSRSEAGCVEAALAGDVALARQLARIRKERDATVALNEALGAPSARALRNLFAAIDAEPAPYAANCVGNVAAKIRRCTGT